MNPTKLGSRHLGVLLVLLGLSDLGPAQSAQAPAAPPSPAASSHASYAAHLAAAEKALRLGEARELRRWLDQAPNALRGWEWHFLHRASDTSHRALPVDGRPLYIAANPVGLTLATPVGSEVLIWNAASGTVRAVLRGHEDAIYRAEFSPDGERIVTVSRDVTSRVWSVATGDELSRLELANPAVAATAFSPDGTWVATCAWLREAGEVEGVVWIWDPVTGRIQHEKRVGVKPLSSMAIAADGEHIAVGSWDGLVHWLDDEGNEIRKFTLPDEDIYNAVNDVAVAPNGLQVAAASKDRTVRVFSVTDGRLIATLRGHGDYVQGVRFSPDGSRLISASADATLRVWNTKDWRPFAVLRGHLDAVRSAVWTNDQELVSCSLDESLRVWDLTATHAPHRVIESGTDGTYTATFAPDGQSVLTACFDGLVRSFEASTGNPAKQWLAHPGSTCNLLARSRGGAVVTCSWDKTAKIWNGVDSEPIHTLTVASGVYSCDFSADGRLVALTTGSRLEIWDARSGERRHALEGSTRLGEVRFNPDGTQVAVVAAESAPVWNSVTGTRIATLSIEPDGSSLTALSFSPAGDALVAGDSTGRLRRFTLADGTCGWITPTGLGAVRRVVYSPDGTRIAAAAGQAALIVDPVRGTELLRYSPLADRLYNLTWSPDGTRLAVCSANGTLAVLSK